MEELGKDKIGRVLSIYTKLMNGELVQKEKEAIIHGVNERSIQRDIEDIRMFIEELHLEKSIVYGFSDGGIVALLIAIKYPDLLSKVIGSGVNVNPNGLVKGWHFIFRLIYFFGRSSKFKLMLTEPDITAEMLGTIRIPVLLTGGSKDMIQQKHMKYVADSIPGAELVIFSGEKHESYIVHSQRIAEVIIEECVDLR